MVRGFLLWQNSIRVLLICITTIIRDAANATYCVYI